MQESREVSAAHFRRPRSTPILHRGNTHASKYAPLPEFEGAIECSSNTSTARCCEGEDTRGRIVDVYTDLKSEN